MTTPANFSTPDTRAAALAMFEHAVPCFFQMLDPSCEQLAVALAHFVHEESQSCGRDEVWPVCPEHQQALRRMSLPFWRVWYAMAALPCPACEKPIRVDRFEAL